VWLGEDGGIWFANTGANSIGRLDPHATDLADTIQTFGEPPDVGEPFDIKDGPDGWLWFTNQGGNTLGGIFTGQTMQNRGPSAKVTKRITVP
jgi:virginiamycin B lyase